MLMASVALAFVGAAASAAVDVGTGPAVIDERVAVNPNLGTGACTLGGETIRVSFGMLESQVTGAMTGSLSANQDQPPSSLYCSGYVPPEPQYCVSVQRAGYYVFHVVAGGGVDTVLVMRDAEGTNNACDDDGGTGLLSRLEVWLEPGSYSLYVGTFSQGVSATYQMNVQSYGE